jgi:hypothetical protein
MELSTHLSGSIKSLFYQFLSAIYPEIGQLDHSLVEI